MTKKPTTTTAKTRKAPAASVTPAKPSKAPRKAPAALGAGLIVPKNAPAAFTLTAPPAELPAVPMAAAGRKPRKDARTEPSINLGFNVPVSFAKDFKAYSFERGSKNIETLTAALAALKEKEAL